MESDRAIEFAGQRVPVVAPYYCIQAKKIGERRTVGGGEGGAGQGGIGS